MRDSVLETRLIDRVANGIRIDSQIAEELAKGKVASLKLYIDGDRYLDVELKLNNARVNIWSIR